MQVSGSYKIPTVRLRTLYPNLEDLFRGFDDKEFTKEDFRAVLNINPKSSGLMQKILDFKAYGLLEETNEKLRITEAGKKLLRAKDKEWFTELQNTVNNVPLWKILFEQYNTNLDSQNFWNILSRITQLDADSAKAKSEKILKAYFDDVNFALSGNAQHSHTTTRPRRTKSQQIPLITPITAKFMLPGRHDEQNIGYSLYSDYGDFQFTISDDATFNIAKIAFDEIFKAIKIELDSKNKKTQNGIEDLEQ